jgi:hypothetical protein
VRAVLAAAAVLALAGCGGSAPHGAPAATRPPTSAAAPAAAAGCDRASLIMAAVRTQIDSGQIAAAASQLRKFADSLPAGTLKDDVYAALLNLDKFNLDALQGNSVDKDAQDFARSFSAIADYCAAAR